MVGGKRGFNEIPDKSGNKNHTVYNKYEDERHMTFSTGDNDPKHPSKSKNGLPAKLDSRDSYLLQKVFRGCDTF